jgi:hypothetical protein
MKRTNMKTTLKLLAALLLGPLAALHAAETSSKADKPVVAATSDGGHMGIQHTDLGEKQNNGTGIAFEPPHYIPPLNVSPGAKYAPEQCKYILNDSIERAPKGRLWASWYAGRDQEDRFGYTCLATSGDDGKTWSDIRLVIDPDSNGPMQAIDNTIWLDPKGHLWMFFVITGIRAQDLIDQGLKNWQSYGHAIYAITTENPDDPNPVWSEPRFICTGVVKNKPIALSSGDWLLPVARWKDAPSIHIVSSADTGKTWSLRGGVTIPPPEIRECDEPCIIERKDGSIWVTSRTKNGIYESSSPDDGRTWSEASKYLPHTVSRFQIRRLLSGNLILLRHGNPQEDAAGRTNLMAFLSDDDGKSWKGGLLVEKEYSSYPDVASQAPDGTIYVSFDRGRGGFGLNKILMSRFKESDILAGKFESQDSATGLEVYQGLGKNRENWLRDGRWLKRSWNEKEKPFREGPAAEIDAAPFETGRMNQGVKLFSDRPYVADNIDDEIIAMSIDPKLGLKGQRNFVIAPFEGTKSVKVTKPGMLYLISRRDGNEAALITAGFEKCRIGEFILFVKPENNNKAVVDDFCSVYQKEVKIGELVTFGPGAVLFFSGGASPTK